jgi:C-terminal processing protease CtpA/Prc
MAGPWPVLLAVGAAVLLAVGCQGPAGRSPGSEITRATKYTSVEITPEDDEFAELRTESRAARAPRRDASELTESELYEPPKFTVSRKGFAKFGLSVVTNTEVAVGGAIEWMRVGVVIPGSAAARQGLFTGVEILAIDNLPVARISREHMLHLLFERESGQQVRLLVYSRQFGPLPRFVTL